MGYGECKIKFGDQEATSIAVCCDALIGKRVCGNEANVVMNKREDAGKFLFDLGWRLVRGRQVCGQCMARHKDHKNIRFRAK